MTLDGAPVYVFFAKSALGRDSFDASHTGPTSDSVG